MIYLYRKKIRLLWIQVLKKYITFIGEKVL